MSSVIKIFDTTLRDGEQSPGCSMNLSEKVKVAKQLEKMKVDVIEAGFAIASPGDFEAVEAVAKEIKNCTIASLARALPRDIETAWRAVEKANMPRIHTFIATSPLHMEFKLKMSPEKVLEQTREMVTYARSLAPEVEFSAEDASRSEIDFLCRVVETAIDAGATIINLPDTVGYAIPDEYGFFISQIMNRVPNMDKAIISVHCHNDLGLGVANTLAAIKAGARQVECTINGIGERAGNAALEEIVMALHTRKDIFGATCGVDTRQIYPASRLLSQITGQRVQANKAIVGENAFAHESGIHQHGMIAHRETYEIMRPEDVGLSGTKMVLGKHSGKHGLIDRLRQMGYDLDDAEYNEIFEQFKKLADAKKNVDDRDIQALMDQHISEAVESVFQLERFVINSGNDITATANIRISKGDDVLEGVATGDGPVDAAFNAVSQLTGTAFLLEQYRIEAVTEGTDAMGRVDVRITDGTHAARGQGVSTDIIESSIRAYLEALNKLLWVQKREAKTS